MLGVSARSQHQNTNIIHKTLKSKLMDEFIRKLQACQRFLNNGVFEVVGNEAVSHYKKSFRDEGFTNKTLVRWKEVKRRINPRNKAKASARLPILTQSGELGNSIRWRLEANAVIISSDKVYAEVHNIGGRAGRGRGFRMPKRQFIGHSSALNLRINQKIKDHITRILK